MQLTGSPHAPTTVREREVVEDEHLPRRQRNLDLNLIDA
jgi:hypothetical protein